MMVTIRTIKQITMPLEINILPIFGCCQRRAILEEILEVHYNQDTCHDGGWETKESWEYLPANEELLKEIIEKRKQDGWIESGKHIYPILTKTIEDIQLRLNYFLGQKIISRPQYKILKNWEM